MLHKLSLCCCTIVNAPNVIIKAIDINKIIVVVWQLLFVSFGIGYGTAFSLVWCIK